MAEIPPITKVYAELLDWCRRFSRSGDTQEIDGEAYSLPGQTVYTTTTLKLPEGGRIEVNLTPEQMQKTFSWIAEITIDDAGAETYEHFLLQNDGAIVETYGKQVIPVDESKAKATLAKLKRLAQLG